MDDAAGLQRSIEQVAGVLFLLLFAYLLIELGLLHFRRRHLKLREARMAALGVASQGVAAAVVARLAAPLSVGVAATVGASFSPIDAGLSWPWWIAGFVLYELSYWIQHWAAHKVRLLWCIHSPHHAPGGIHMLIGANHSFLESVFYFPLFFGFVPALFGVHPVIAVAVNVVDGIWGSFLHISDEIVPKGRYGVLERFMQTPSYHRVHHAKNVRYMDTNYNSITLLWDWLFGTLQPLRDDEPVDYGITRKVDTGSFWDVHFGEFVLLARDLQCAPTLRAKLGYLLRPPGWVHDGAPKTAAARKAALDAVAA